MVGEWLGRWREGVSGARPPGCPPALPPRRRARMAGLAAGAVAAAAAAAAASAASCVQDAASCSSFPTGGGGGGSEGTDGASGEGFVELRGWVPRGELRVSHRDWRIYDFRALEEREGGRRGAEELRHARASACTPAAEPPTTAFAMRHLGLQGAQVGPSGCSPYVLSRVAPGQEARFDAHDDTCYTRAQLVERYAQEYKEDEIAKYWESLPPWWRPPEFGCLSWSHLGLHRNLCLHGILRSGRVLDAVLQTDRVHYSPEPRLAYYETAQEFGDDATLSSPRIHTCCIEAVAPSCGPGAAVLDIGCGTGFVTAVLARLAGPGGRVLGLDVVEEYVARTRENLEKDALGGPLRSGLIEARLGDGWWGSEDDGPFDVIHMACSSPSVPDPLVRQLKEGGRLILPVGPATPQWQNLTVITKHPGGGLSAEVIRPVRYVTMVHPPLMLRDTASALKVDTPRESGGRSDGGSDFEA